jgi:hypothetical protein
MEKNTNPRITKFISSRQMASSEIQERIINLGKALVEELGSRVGTPTRWMAHYIAEQMTFAENGQGDARISAEKKCFETILKLWQHHSSLPDGRRPFESFELIFRVLDRLNPENKQPFYFNDQRASMDSDESTKEEESVQQWLDFIFKQAALCATDEKTSEWLENSLALSKDDDTAIIISLLKNNLENPGEIPDESKKNRKIQLIKDRIKKLEVFGDFNQKLLSIMKEELGNISGYDDTSKDEDSAK